MLPKDELQRYQDGPLLRWTFEDLHCIAVNGISEVPLEDLGKADLGIAYEAGPVVRQRSQDLIAMVTFEPSMNLTVSKLTSDRTNTGIVIASLNLPKAQDLLRKTQEALQFEAVMPDGVGFYAMREGVGPEITTYQATRGLTGRDKTLLEKIWGASKYGLFLVEYTGMSHEEAQVKAWKKFDIPI